MKRRVLIAGVCALKVRYTLTVVDVANDCAPPRADALVEIRHCDALGENSGSVGNNGHQEEDIGTFPRGGRTTDESGRCAITSIRPGHFVSRAVQVHMRVHTDVTLTDDSYTGGEVIHTGQLFFDPHINTEVQATSPCSENTTKETRLEVDGICWASRPARASRISVRMGGDSRGPGSAPP